MTLRAARLATLASAVAAVVVHAWLRGATGGAWWPGPLALLLGAAAGRRWPGAALPAFLGLGAVWQAGAFLSTGSTDIQCALSWLAALTGAIAAADRVAPWALPNPWTAPIASWALTLALTWPVVVARELDFTRATLHADTTNGVFSPDPATAAALALVATVAQMVALLVFDAWSRPRAADARRHLVGALGLGLACAGLIALYQGTRDPGFLSREPWPRLGRAAGTFFDANALAAFAVFTGPLIAGHAWASGGLRGRAGAAGVLLFALAAIVASGSRTSFAAWLVSVTVFAAVVVRRPAGSAHDRWRSAVVVLALVVVAAGLVRTGVAARGGSNPISRIAGGVTAAGGVGGLLHAAWDRDGYGPTSVAMIADHPWVGVGSGAFGLEVSDYATATLGKVLPPDNAQNWWRHLLAELGLLGSLGGLLTSLLAAGVVARRVIRAAPLRDAGAVAAAVALGGMALVSPPTQHPVIQVIVAVVLAIAVGLADGGHRRAAVPAPRWTGPLVWALALACVAALAVDAWTVSRPPLRGLRFGFVYNHGLSPLLPRLPGQDPGTQRRWMGTHAVAVVPPAATTLVIRLDLPHQDLAAAPVDVAVDSPGHAACHETRRDATPVECRVPTNGQTTLVEVRVSRTWPSGEGQDRGALVTAWYER